MDSQDQKPTKPPASERECYFEQLQKWVDMANLSQKAATSFPYFLLSNYPQLFQSQQQQLSSQSARNPLLQNATTGVAGPARPGENRLDDLFNSQARMEQIIARNGGYEFVIAPSWKRILAEIIDVLILMFIKLMVTFTIIDLFDLDLSIDILNIDSLKKSFEDDYTEFLSFSSDLLTFEIITKIAVCFYETLWTMYGGNNTVGGATPGKIIMGLRILHVDAVVILPPQPQPQIFNINQNMNRQPIRALLFPAQNPGVRRALIRAVAKNVMITLMFPLLCFFVMIFKNNRTSYDVLSSTIVVEENHMPVLRRPVA